MSFPAAGPLQIVGHRGAIAEAPENTVDGFVTAERIGVSEIETDLRLTADGELVLVHDATLDRVAVDDTGRGLGGVAVLTYAAISHVDLGGGRRVPRLAELYDATTATIQLEIKDPAVVTPLVDFFARRPEAARRTLLTGFSPDAVADAAERLPTIDRGIIVSTWQTAQSYDGGWRGLVDKTRSVRVHTGFADLSPDDVAELHAAGLPVHVWPLRDRDDVATALQLGADGGTSDDPRSALEWVLETS